MGNTQILEQLFKAEDMIDVIKKFIHETIGNEKYIIIGESYGGYLMRKLIKDEPDKILGAMFICPVILPDNNKRELPEKKIMYNSINDKKILENGLYKSFLETTVFSDEETLKEFEESIYPGINSGNEQFLTKYQESGYGFQENIDDLKKTFQEPSLFIMGKQDHIVGYKDSFKIIENYPHASICVIDESGHNVQIEKKKVMKVLTLEWLDRIVRKGK
jgi:pimeloyl-ACP methyl ester carboxylesterase